MIGSVVSLNNISETRYQFTDKEIFASNLQKIYYYRLKQIEHDGSFKYSTIVKVENSAQDNYVQLINSVFSNSIKIRTALQHSETTDFINSVVL